MINIYLDVDGVLLTKEHTPSNYSNEFIQYVIRNYPNSTYWLTTRCKGDQNTVLDAIKHLFEPQTQLLMEKIIPTDWRTSKTEAIDFTKPFLWFDDNLFSFERHILDSEECLENWIEVNVDNHPDQLRDIVSSFPIPLT